MSFKRQGVIIAIISLLVLACLLFVSVSLSGSGLHGAHAASTLPAQYFAPYWEDGEGDSLQVVEQKTGQKYFTLAFVISDGSCQASSLTSTSDIQALRDLGGDVIQSFGGAAGQELAQSCQDASSLQAQYQAVVTKLNLTHLDFDIEGGQESDATTYKRRNTALAALQAANPGLTISFTLPAGTDGLEGGSLDLLKDAVSQGVTFNVVNLMVMDYGSPNSTMGQAAIDAGNSLYGQLQDIFPQQSASALWSMVGLTAMIGKNDSQDETFTLDNATQVLTFAQQNHIGELSFWVVSRDNPSCPDFQWSDNNTSLDTCDGLSEPEYAFTKTWQPYSSDVTGTDTSTPTLPVSPTGSPVATPYPTMTPTPTPELTPTPTMVPTPTPTPELTPTPTMVPTSTPTPGLTPTPTTQPTATPTPTNGHKPPTRISTGDFSGSYYIVNQHSEKVLDDTDWSSDNGTTIQQWTKEPGQTNQQWTLVPASHHTYYIVNKYSGKVLDDTDWSGANGTTIQQWSKANNQTNQQWSLVPVGPNAYYIVNQHSGKALDDTDWSSDNGTTIQQWSKMPEQTNQRWILQKA